MTCTLKFNTVSLHNVRVLHFVKLSHCHICKVPRCVPVWFSSKCDILCFCITWITEAELQIDNMFQDIYKEGWVGSLVRLQTMKSKNQIWAPSDQILSKDFSLSDWSVIRFMIKTTRFSLNIYKYVATDQMNIPLQMLAFISFVDNSLDGLLHPEPDVFLTWHLFSLFPCSWIWPVLLRGEVLPIPSGYVDFGDVAIFMSCYLRAQWSWALKQ